MWEVDTEWEERETGRKAWLFSGEPPYFFTTWLSEMRAGVSIIPVW